MRGAATVRSHCPRAAMPVGLACVVGVWAGALCVPLVRDPLSVDAYTVWLRVACNAVYGPWAFYHTSLPMLRWWFDVRVRSAERSPLAQPPLCEDDNALLLALWRAYERRIEMLTPRVPAARIDEDAERCGGLLRASDAPTATWRHPILCRRHVPTQLLEEVEGVAELAFRLRSSTSSFAAPSRPATTQRGAGVRRYDVERMHREWSELRRCPHRRFGFSKTVHDGAIGAARTYTAFDGRMAAALLDTLTNLSDWLRHGMYARYRVHGDTPWRSETFAGVPPRAMADVDAVLHGSPMHAAASDNYFVQLVGCRRWLLVPPWRIHLTRPTPGYNYVAAWGPYRRPLDMDPRNRTTRAHPLMEHIPDRHEIVMGPGDVLYVPGWWLHEVSVVPDDACGARRDSIDAAASGKRRGPRPSLGISNRPIHNWGRWCDSALLRYAHSDSSDRSMEAVVLDAGQFVIPAHYPFDVEESQFERTLSGWNATVPQRAALPCDGCVSSHSHWY